MLKRNDADAPLAPECVPHSTGIRSLALRADTHVDPPGPGLSTFAAWRHLIMFRRFLYDSRLLHANASAPKMAAPANAVVPLCFASQVVAAAPWASRPNTP